MPFRSQPEDTPNQQSRNNTALSTSVRYIKGVGEQGQALLARLGIHNVYQLLQHYPFRYEDRTTVQKVARLHDGQIVTLRLRVTELESRQAGRSRRMVLTRVAAEDDTGTIVLVWFNQPWVKERMLRMRGKEIIVYGTVRYGRLGFEINSPTWEPVGEDDADPWAYGKFVPVYPLTEGLTQGRIRNIIRAALEKYVDQLPENLPQQLRRSLNLIGSVEAANLIHWSETEAQNRAAHKRLAFEELFYLQLALAQMRYRHGIAAPGAPHTVPADLLQTLQQNIPFELTDAQKKVIAEIWMDMKQPHPMNRLVQGDVGSGKTVVALAAMLLAAKNGYQSALMAPTEVLAEQHFINLQKLAEGLDLRIAHLAGSTKAANRKLFSERLAAGHVDIAVGTHALLQEGVEFHNLGLIVVDEQHKFGVRQRSALREKGPRADMLVMTATPIPRTLTMTLYGDLDISVIDQLPVGRKPVKTHVKDHAQRLKVYEGLRTLLQKGGRAFVVCPLVEESDKLQSKAATTLAEELQAKIFPEFSIRLLHGQMKSEEKQDAIEAFRNGACQVLVCTTVVEVGVDVPDANAIIIENAERYGLAQLHQLRGRVGRSDQQSFCVLLADAKTEGAISRLDVMASSNDGFVIAEEDLSIRGPGEFFGTRQAGVPALKVANILRDTDLIEQAKIAAEAIIKSDPELADSENAALKLTVEEQYYSRMLETVA